MDSEVETFLIQVGKEIGRTPEQMKPFIKKIVEDNWYETMDSLRELTDAQWQSLGLPGRLTDVIRIKLKNLGGASGGTAAAPPQPVQPPPPQPVPAVPAAGAPVAAAPPRVAAQAAPAPAPGAAGPVAPTEGGETGTREECTHFAPVPPAGVRFPSDPAHSMVQLQDGLCADREALSNCLQTLLKLVDAVLSSPMDPKKRIIRKGNENFFNRVGRHQNAIIFLLAIGFEEEGEFLKLRAAYISRLTDAHHLLSEALAGFGVHAPPVPSGLFNPFKSSFGSTEVGSRITQNHIEQKAKENANVAAEIRRREKLLKSGGVDPKTLPPLPLDPRAFHQSSISRLEDALKEMAATGDDLDSAAVVDRADLAKLKEALTDGPKFKSRAKEQLAQLEKQKIYSKCILRVQFPDKTVLQLNFRPFDTIRHVKQNIVQ
eukprot:Cvel_28202.t1-p1 / transcript=Cvel_28202.t1 / gene=Cvel_28202 / organism=Chromera_velia_CCMP2878 / gene_product=hypothetical protein / transcript_product=hypothetical protein / location=Cvel_scaffold3647:752-6126(-) / protein_length=429 / sequence_SO=supercontig / SO=protein_coding / is_pseudo=false